MIKQKIWRRCVANILFLQLLAFPLHTYQSTDLPRVSWTQEDLSCLSKTIHHEARGESYKGMLAVAHVVLNRTKSERFPSTICEVVYQKTNKTCQFSWACVKIKTRAMKEEVYTLAVQILNGETRDPTKGALFFHNKEAESFERRKTVEIGNHIFYR